MDWWLLVKRMKWSSGQNATWSDGHCLFRLQTLVYDWETNGGRIYSSVFSFIYSFVHVYCLNIQSWYLSRTYDTNEQQRCDRQLPSHWALQPPVAYQVLCDRSWASCSEAYDEAFTFFFSLRFSYKTLPQVILLLFITCTMWDNGTSV